jgi:hypothetical protein
MGAALWVFNPIALAYGHLAITEPGIAFAYPLAVWWFVKTADAPTPRNVVLLGVAAALAMQMKFLALILGPTFVALLILEWIRDRKVAPTKTLAKWLGLFVAGAWGATLAVYVPHWSAPPPIDPAQAAVLRVPGWFQVFRPLLIPSDFFKAVALKLLHSQAGQDAFLCGEWRTMGWWYYYPLAMWFKTPIPLLVLVGVGAVLLLRSAARRAEFASLVPWVAAALFLASALTSTINTGMRHVLPVYPMLAVGAADQLARLNRNWQIGAWVLCGWLAAVAAFAYPHFIPYTNEFCGGTANGYKCLIDSNYDWGQDGKRLKKWMNDNKINHIYLDFFGTQTAVEWHRIPNTRVSAEQAKQIRQGVLVVSVSQLMRPEWTWLREQRQPDARISDTLFAYRF